MGQYVRSLTFVVVAACTAVSAGALRAAPYAAVVMDARTGETLYENNADTRLHPASLTKMMTLYITFEAIQRGEISLDTMVTVSKHAASQPPSKLGLRSGQKIALRYLIRAAAVKSANDAATAICEAVGGSQAQFAARMNRTAKAIGMRSTTFKNCNGLTSEGHLSTARDMNTMGRRLFFDFPQYYNIFSRRTADAGMAKVNNTNTRFLDAYKGADGIKTGYTNPAGFNLTASAERGNKRIIATIFGGKSTAQRNAKMTELMDLGFKAAPSGVDGDIGDAPGKTIRMVMAVATSPRPLPRPGLANAAAAAQAVTAMQGSIDSALAEAATAGAVEAVVASIAPENGSIVNLSASLVPQPRPEVEGTQVASVVVPTPVAPVPTAPEVVTRMSTSGGRHWGINVGRFPSNATAERQLMTIALAESGTLTDGLRKIVQRGGGYDANFMGLTQDQADLACRRLQARAVQCFAIGP